MKRMTAKKRLLVVFIAAVAVGATVALVFIFQFFGDAVRERSDLYISARTDYPGLLDSLRPRTDHHWAFDRYAGRLELERSFKPGHYVLEPGMNVVEIARMLKLGMQTPVRVTLNYARTRAFLASRLARQLDADSAELMRALTDPQRRLQPPYFSLLGAAGTRIKRTLRRLKPQKRRVPSWRSITCSPMLRS